MLSRTCTILSALKVILFIVYPPPNQNAISVRAGTWPVSFTAVSPASRMDRYLLVERRGRNSGKKKPTVPMGSLNFSTVIRKRLFCRHMMLSLLLATGISEDYTQRTIQWQMCNSLLCGDIPNTEVCQCAGKADVLQTAWRANTAVLDTWPAQKRVGRTLTS